MVVFVSLFIILSQLTFPDQVVILTNYLGKKKPSVATISYPQKSKIMNFKPKKILHTSPTLEMRSNSLGCHTLTQKFTEYWVLGQVFCGLFCQIVPPTSVCDSNFSWRRAQIIALFVNLVFLGQAFTIMLVYIWSRRNPYIRMNFFGLLTFKAPFLPWVLFGFSLMLGNSVMVDLIGNILLFKTTILLLT